jgi:hypothetical protein
VAQAIPCKADTESALQAQCPELKPQYHQEKKKYKELAVLETAMSQ